MKITIKNEQETGVTITEVHIHTKPKQITLFQFCLVEPTQLTFLN